MADWMCPHTPDICEYAETCATKLAVELARLKGVVSQEALAKWEGRQFVQVTSGGWSQVIAVGQIARIFKNANNHPDDTSIQLKNGTTVAVEESIKTIQCRIGVPLLP